MIGCWSSQDDDPWGFKDINIVIELEALFYSF